MKTIILFLIFFIQYNLLSQEEKTKSPNKAMLFSIIPGAGQVYNEDYWKAPILFGGAGIMLGFALHFNGLANEIDELILVNQENSGYLSQLKRRREFYIDNRDQFYLYLGAIYVVSLLDAYTGAHLYNFDINNDTSLNFGLINSNKVGIELKIQLLK